MEPDFLDEMIAKRTKANPEFPVVLDAARAARAERLTRLKAKLEARVAGPPEVPEGALVGEILKPRGI